MSEKIDLMSKTRGELEALLASMGEPRFRAGQLFSWLHRHRAAAFCEMTNLPERLRNALEQQCYIAQPAELTRQQSKDGTVKFLFSLADGNTIESVLMRHNYGNSLCISSQVGCNMGCKFCASTIGGKARNLTAGEMLGQVYAAGRLTGERVDSIVMMGIGEPLDNFDEVLRFLELLSDPEGFGMSLRHLSLSTCGLCDRIDELAQKKLQLTLSVSLHACDNETRDRIMPVNKRYPIERLMDSCRRYFALTGRRISYEYALIAGVNDSPQDARKLAALLSGQNCHINLIPVNPVAETGFSRGSRESSERFREILEKEGFSATIRRELGTDIDAACGQLRRKEQKRRDGSCG